MQPLFIISVPRSGSTLLASLLDATGVVSMLHEPGFFPRPTGVSPPRVLRTWGQLSLYLEMLWRCDPVRTYPEAAQVLCEIALGESTPIDVAEVWRRYGHGVAERRGREGWGFTNPHGPQWAARQLDWLPETHPIVLLRDPVGVAASFFTRNWGVLWWGRYGEEVRAAAAALAVRDFYQPVVAAIAGLSPSQRTILRLEGLVASPVAALEVLSPLLGHVDWADVEEHYRSTAIASTATASGDLHSGLRHPVAPSVAARAETALSLAHRRIIVSVLAPILDRLGYGRPSTQRSTDESHAIRKAWVARRTLEGARYVREQAGGRVKWAAAGGRHGARVLGDRVPTPDDWRRRAV
jgi:hypothetical protein